MLGILLCNVRKYGKKEKNDGKEKVLKEEVSCNSSGGRWWVELGEGRSEGCRYGRRGGLGRACIKVVTVVG